MCVQALIHLLNKFVDDNTYWFSCRFCVASDLFVSDFADACFSRSKSTVYCWNHD